MPWLAKDAVKFVKGLSESQSEKWASHANAILKSCLASGKDESECEKIALATAAKHVAESADEGGKTQAELELEAKDKTADTPTKIVLENGMELASVSYPASYAPKEIQDIWMKAWNASWKKHMGLVDHARIYQCNTDADESVRKSGWLMANGKWITVEEAGETKEQKAAKDKKDAKSAVEDADSNARKVKPVDEAQSIRRSGATFDKDAGVIKGAMIFAPPIDKKTGFYRSDKGEHYDDTYFKSVAENAKDAFCWDGHPDTDPNGGRKMRSPMKALAKCTAAKVVEENGRKGVRADFKVTPHGKKEDFVSTVEEAADIMGFSVFSQRNYYRVDPVHYVEVTEEIDPTQKRKISLDFVECSGATKSVHESADEGGKQSQTTNKDELNMDPKELQKLINDAIEEARKKVVAENAGADEAKLNAKIKEAVEAAQVATMEKLKPELDKAHQISDEHEALKKSTAVKDVMETAKIAPEHRVQSLIVQLESMYPDKPKMEAAVQAHKEFLAKNVPEQTKTTAEIGSTGGFVGGTRSIKEVVETCESRGFTEMVKEICEVAEEGPGREKAQNAKWQKSRLADIENPRIQTEEMRKLRRMVSESWSPRRICEYVLGHPLSSDKRVGLKEVAEAALDSTIFSTINSAVLAAHVIERYQINISAANNNGWGLIAPQLSRLMVSNTEHETYAGMTAPGVMADVNELAAPLEAVMDEKLVTDPVTKPKKRAVYVALSREEVYFDKTGQVLERANAVADHGAVDEERSDLNGIFELNGVRSYRPGGVQTNLFQNGLHGNVAGGNAFQTIEQIQQAAKKLRGMTDENGDKLLENQTPPLVFVFPNALWDYAHNIIMAREYERRRPTGTSDEVAHVPNGYQNSIVLGSPYLDAASETTWYVGSQRGWQKQYTRKRLFPFEVLQIPQAEIQGTLKDAVAGVKVQWWGWIVARDYRYVIKCTSGVGS